MNIHFFSQKQMWRLFFVFLSVVLLFNSNQTLAALSPSKKTQNPNVDEALVRTYLRYGNYVPDAVLKEMGFRGTGFAVTPSNYFRIIAAVVGKGVFGISPQGIAKDTSDMVTDLQNSKAFSQEEADLLRELGPVIMGIVPTKIASSSKDTDDPFEQGIITSLETGLSDIAFGDHNSTKTAVFLVSAANARTAELTTATISDLTGGIAENEGVRDVGGTSISINSEESPLSHVGGIVTPNAIKNTQLSLIGGVLQALQISNNPDGGGQAISTGKSPSNLADANASENIKSASVSGDGGHAGKAREVAGFTDEKPGSSLGNLADITRLALANSANQINNRLNQLTNAQNRFPNGRLNQLQNQFPPNTFNNQLANRFPSSGGSGGTGGGGGTPPASATPTQPDTTTCNPANAVLSHQEVLDIADFMGLPTTSQDWTKSYFLAQQFIDQNIYLPGTSTLRKVDLSLVPDPTACVWVVYSPSIKTGVFSSDVRSQTGTKFLFRMP